MKVYYLAFRLDYLVPHFDLRREIRDAMGEFSRLLLATAAAQIPARAIRVATDGNSWWLKYCQAAIEDLPCLRTEGPADIVITDSQTGEGWYFSLNGQRLSPDLREFFWHANRGSHPIDLSLHSEDGVEGCLRIEPQHGFFWLEHHAAAMEAAPALLIVAILRRLGCSVRPADPPVQTHPSAASPGSLPLNWFRFKKFSRSLYLRMPGTGLADGVSGFTPTVSKPSQNPDGIGPAGLRATRRQTRSWCPTKTGCGYSLKIYFPGHGSGGLQ